MTDSQSCRPFSFSQPFASKPVAAASDARATHSDARRHAARDRRTSRFGIAERSARCFPDRRDPLRITHALARTSCHRARILADTPADIEDAERSRRVAR